MPSSGMLRRVVLTRATRRNIAADTILHSHRRENLKSYDVIPITDHFRALNEPIVRNDAWGTMQTVKSTVAFSIMR
jgi:hypothetical protein